MRIDKLIYKEIDDIRACGNCGLLLPKSVGIMNHLEKCRSKEQRYKS